MSSTGQIVGGIAGGIIGSFAGKPWLGAQIGMMLGGYLDPGKGPTVNGPTLDDLTVQTSTYGAMIPRLYGTISVTGNVIWLENNLLTATVTKTKSGGKGGQKTVTRTTTYSATFAVALCQGPIVGIRRMWLRSDLVYDAGSSDPSTIIASNQSAEGWTLYTGTDTQGADPRMQATLGVGNTPAWRGLAYIVFEDLQLARYSNSLPGVQVKVEVMMASSPYTWSSTTDALPAYDTWAEMAASPTTAVCVPRVGSSRIAVTHDGRVWEAKSTSTSAHRGCVAFGNGIFIAMREGLGCDKSTDDGETWLQIDSVAGRDWVVNPVNAYPPYSGYSYDSMVYGNGVFCAVSYDTVGVTDDGINWRKGAMPSSGSWNITHNGAGLFVAVNGGTNNAATSADGLTWTARTMAAVGNWSGITYGNGLFVAVGYSGGSPIQTSPDGITWTEPLVTGTHNYHTVSWTREHFIAPGYGSAVASISLDGTTWSDIALPSSQLWEGSQSFLGSTIIVAYNSSISTLLNVTRVGAGEHLSDVVTSECLYSGLLTTDDIQASALTSIVPGYRIGTVGTLRSALEPLQAAWPFDVVQSGYKLKFKPRGSASVATVLAGDLGARESSQGEAVGIVRTREIDSQLPRRLTVRYLDSSREYDIGSQYAERLSTLTVRETTLDLSIVLDSSQAAGKAEVLLYAAWMGRVKLSFTLPDTYRNLEPADVITLPTPDGPMTVRLTTVNYTSDNLVSCSATLDQASTYSPVALGVSPTTTGQTTIAPLGLTTYALLDIPRVSSAQDLVGFPVAMCGGTAWPGGVLMRSSDLGATWAEPLSFGPPGAAIGTASTVIGAVESRLIDVASSLTVTLTSGTLSDVSELSMLNGANYFAYGVAGRWEIIAARTCTLQSGTTYILSNMLRGQFGTEWAMGLHATGDTVVLLDSSELQVLEQSSGDIGAPRTYRAITSGRDISTGSDRAMTYDAVNLKPLSPVYLRGARNTSTNAWEMEWTRRTRVGGEWRDSVDAELGEVAESYEIEVFADGTYTTVKRAVTTSTPYYSYSESNQGADFGSTQDSLYLKVRQLSSSVGRGYPLSASLAHISPTGYLATITVPPSSVSSSLTDFPLFIDLSLMSVSWWGSLFYRDGRDIRVTNNVGTQIPFDLVFIDAQNRTGYMFIKTNLSSVTATTVIISIGLAANGFVAPTDPNGRNAVWSNYHRVVTFGHDHSDRTGNGYTAAYAPTLSMNVSATGPNTSSHQGVSWDGVYYYVSDTNRLRKYDSTWTLVASNTNPLGSVGGGVNHLGDIEVVDGILYAPVESYTSPSVFSLMTIARFDAGTLAYIDSVSVAAQGHEVSSIAYCAQDGYLYVSSYSDGSKLWKYNKTTLAYVGSTTLSTVISTIQGVTWWNEAFWVSSGSDSKVYRVEQGGTVRGSVYGSSSGADDFEGVSHTDEGLLLLVDVTGSAGNGVVRTLKPKSVGSVAAVEFSGNVDQFEYLTGLTRYTSWTMGASVKLDNKAAIQGLMTYTVNGSSLSSDRVSIAYRLSSDRLGLWNDTDTWLLDTISPVVGTVYRINASHNGTAGRKFYRDGVLTASAGSCTARPSASANALVFGIESWMRGEDMSGSMGFAYLAPVQFSDQYVAAEASNLIAPSTFYTISE